MDWKIIVDFVTMAGHYCDMDLVALTLIFNMVTKEYKLPPKLIDSVCYVESKYYINAVHHDDGHSDSLGLCQIKLKTAQWLGFKGTVKELMKPEVNTKYAGRYLGYQLRRYHGDITKAIIAYNQGSAKHLTTTKYSTKVLTQLRSVKHENN